MRRIKLKILIFVFFIILLTSVSVFADETALDYMNNLVGPSEQYNSMVTPAYTRTNTVEDFINPQTGELTLAQTDYVLPGVNGLDLLIKRLYKSGAASAWKNSVQYNQYNVLVDYLDNTGTTNNSYANTFYEMRYNLGVGWRFSFPTMEKIGNDPNDQNNHIFLHTESGDVYNLSGPDTNGVFTIVNHPVQDLTVKTSSSNAFTSQGTYTNGQSYTLYSAYVMTEKNGKNTYFDSAGRILGIVDRYWIADNTNGNKITFQYKDFNYNLSEGAITKTLISKIIDTMGRTVTMDYKEDPTFTVTGYDPDTQTASGDLQYKFEVEITLPSGKTIVYDKSGMTFRVDTFHVTRTRLQRVYDVDAVLPITSSSTLKSWYGYEQVSLGFTFLNGTTYDSANNNKSENITEVDNWKTNQNKRFIYGDIGNSMYRFVKPLSCTVDGIDYSGSMEYRKVVEVQDVDSNNGSVKNDVTYSYTNEPQGYTFNPPTNIWSIFSGYDGNNQTYLKDTYRYYTQITDGRGAKTKITFDGTGQSINVEKSGNDHKESITTTNDTNKLPQKVETVSYNVVNEVAGASITKTENYLYDSKGNLTQYTGPEATRDASGNPTGSTYTTLENTTVNEHTVVYTYDPNFSLLTSKTWKQDATTVSRIECTINPTNGNVSQIKNVHTGNNIISDFLYDAKGNITQKTVHNADNSGNTYTSNYIYGTEEDGIDRGGATAKYNGVYYGGAYLTRQYTEVDGTQISKKYVYDFNTGIKKADIDEKNNRTNYDYDSFNQLTTITYPDLSTKQYSYDDCWDNGWVIYQDYYNNSVANRVIKYTDQNNNKFFYAYDIFGNLVQYDVYFYDNNDNTWKWKVLRQLNYDSNRNKIKELDAYGHSSQFTYDSANRLKEKSFWSNDSTKTKSLTLQYTIAADSNTPLLVTITDEDGYDKKYHYDILNRVFQQEVTPDKTNFYSTNYTYDYVGHKTSEADALTHATRQSRREPPYFA